MTARRYTQAQVARTFADARAAADKHVFYDQRADLRAVFILGYVEQAFGVVEAPAVAVR